MPQVCTMCKILKDESEFNQIKRKSEVRLAKSCRECNLKKSEEKRRALESTYQQLWIREDGSKITDPQEIVDDHKDHTCDKCRKEKLVKEFVIYGPKYQNCLRYAGSVMVIIDLKMKDAKGMSIKKNGTGMDI